ncbi:glycosyltransferase involved in cell wall biosynthesis [Alkalibacillus filiformis]|uniref:Glycosyltransferase involved in cell wall biosynthesis n=1 Tax=Alkalibacillus filiformis TaxID=200990 RepID=A0ABU0DWB5_9BACI|nr:glycosyltransferase family 4 protein [Alkalibacillus filiformis]MDQ0352763.1 glycosyltransferase involved in cell wall biosynthesis [Alkalibacillus filiformis]
MKVWILNHYAKPHEGRHFKISKYLTEKGHKVKVFSASTIHGTQQNRISQNENYKLEVYDSVPFVFINSTAYLGNEKKRYKNMLDYAWRLLKVSKQFGHDKPDIIYASSVHPLSWLSGYLLAKRYNAKFIAETRDLWPETLVAMRKINKTSVIAKLMYSLEKFIYKKADSLIFTMEGGQSYLEERSIKRKNVYHVNNGVDLYEYNYNVRTYEYNDDDLDDKSSFKIVYTGSMGIANAVDDIIDVAQEIEHRGYTNIKFILFGDGYLRESHQKRVKELGLCNVKFKGKVPKKYIPNILSKSDLNIITGQQTYLYNYGISLNKIFDYFASAKPVISNLKCQYDLIGRHRCGTTVESDSIEDFANEIIQFENLTNENYQQYCKNSLEVAKKYDYKMLTEKIEKVLLKNVSK